MSYQRLEQRFRQLHHLQHLGAICGWDQATMMPSGGNEARGAALAELALLAHQKLTTPELYDWFAQADSESLNAEQQANLFEMRRQWQQATLLPEDLVQAKSLAGSRCEHAWREQRKHNDWAGFAVNLREVVALSREEARIRASALGVSPYDSLLDLYEPGMTSVRLHQLFDDLKSWLPGLIRKVGERQREETVLEPEGPFAIASQQALGLQVMRQLGFDFNHGRLDISTHPFCGGVPEDVRITTRYNEQDFSQSLMGVIHETGHACYEQSLPFSWRQQPAGQARSMAIHESQSLFFEMQLARHPAFLNRLAPLVQTHFGEQPAFAADNLARLYTRVQPGFIRVDADELTYPAHVILRFEIEQALIEGQIEVEDIPALWDSKMRAYLGLSTLGNDRQGCMQDIHWTDGSFGYFPSYTLGAMYAAQFSAALQRELGAMAGLIQSDEGLARLTGWLRRHVWQQASLLPTDALVEQATGEPLNPHWFRQHLEARYLGQ